MYVGIFQGFSLWVIILHVVISPLCVAEYIVGIVFHYLLSSLDVPESHRDQLPVVLFLVVDDLAVGILPMVHELTAIIDLNQNIRIRVVKGASHYAIQFARILDGIEVLLSVDSIWC